MTPNARPSIGIAKKHANPYTDGNSTKLGVVKSRLIPVCFLGIVNENLLKDYAPINGRFLTITNSFK
jgi:hypothetical protein